MARPRNLLPRRPTPVGAAAPTARRVLERQAAAWLEQAVALYGQRELASAEALLNQHLKAVPDSWTGLCLKAILAAQTHREKLAEQLWLRLVQRDGRYLDGHVNLGLLYKKTGRYDEATTHLRRAIAIAPDSHAAHENLGVLHKAQGRYDEALAAFAAALKTKPRAAQTHFNIGTVWQARLDFERACAAYREALRCDSSHQGAQNNLLFTLQYLGDCPPTMRLAEARALGRQLCVGITPRSQWQSTPLADRQLRVGLVSGDLRSHPVGFFLEAVVQALRSSSLTLLAYANHHGEDELKARIRPCFEAWHEVDTWSDAALAQCILDDRIDILMDLSGHSALNRLPVFAHRPAPLQVAWLGYFASTGLQTMDAVLADPVCVPEGEEAYFSEEVWRLPHTRLCFTAPADAPPLSPLPSANGQPFTFGCNQELAKMNDAVLHLWARILARCPHARLRLQCSRFNQAEARNAFIRRLLAAGIPGAQVHLYGPVPRTDYLTAHAELDLMLDTFPYPGGTTTCEALWMGVPTLCLARSGMLGRQGEGLLKAAGLPEFVCSSEDDYVERAVHWASPDPLVRQALSSLRLGLRDQVRASALFDAASFARDFEATLRALWVRHCIRRATSQRDPAPG